MDEIIAFMLQITMANIFMTQHFCPCQGHSRRLLGDGTMIVLSGKMELRGVYRGSVAHSHSICPQVPLKETL